MKKKIKDLTLKEINNICDKCDYCIGCPLSDTIFEICKIDFLDQYGNEKIEVEDDD